MAQLQPVIAEKAKIPAGLESFYVEKDGKFVLDIEGGIKTQVDFDNYAEALKKRFTDAATDFGKQQNAGLSRDDVAKIVEDGLAKFAKTSNGSGDDDGGGKGKGNGQDAETAQRLHDLERNVATLTETNTKLQGERDDAVNTSRNSTIRNALAAAATKAGATPDGVQNLVTLVEPNFELAQDGTILTKLDAKGVTPGTSPENFFANAARDAQFRMFWGKSVGAGADGGDGGSGGGGGDLTKENPWSKAGWNMTTQGKMYKDDQANAEILMKAAGSKLGDIAPVK